MDYSARMLRDVDSTIQPDLRLVIIDSDKIANVDEYLKLIRYEKDLDCKIIIAIKGEVLFTDRKINIIQYSDELPLDKIYRLMIELFSKDT